MYFPKNKIKTSLYTSGNEFVFVNGQDYIGSYWKTSRGEHYTGESPNSVPKEKIFPKSRVADLPTVIPVETIIPTEDDYTLGEFQRYFTRRRNQALFSEITKTTYNDISQGKINMSSNYKLFNLSWKLTGDIINTFQVNKSMVQLVEQKDNLDGLSNFLNNYIQYYRYTPQNNLYTDGSEFMNENMTIYIGPYHIHGELGPMVGAYHTEESHNKLIPYLTEKINRTVIGVGLDTRKYTTQQNIIMVEPLKSNSSPNTSTNYSSGGSGGGSSGGSSY